MINYRLHATNVEANNVPPSSSNTNIYTRQNFPMEEIVEEEVEHEEVELQHMSDKGDHENEIYKDVDDVDDESDVLTQVSGISSYDRSSSFLISPYWLQDERMRKGEVDFLSHSEEEFWKTLIARYLRPIEIDEESQVEVRSIFISVKKSEYILYIRLYYEMMLECY